MTRAADVLLRRVERASILSVILGLSLGYVVFWGVFPTVGFPAAGDASLLAVVAVLLGTAMVAGFATEDLAIGIAAVFASIPLGALFATLIALSPALGGITLVQPDAIPFFLAHYGFIFFMLGFVLNFVGILAGMAFRERYLRRAYAGLPFGSSSRK